MVRGLVTTSVLLLAACKSDDPPPFVIHEPEVGFAVRYNDAVALSGGSVVAVGVRPFGETGALVEVENETWSSIDTDTAPVAVWASGAESVWLGGDVGRSSRDALHEWDGTTLTDLRPDTRLAYVIDIWGTGSTDAWVLAVPGGETSASVLQWDGEVWREHAIPRPVTEDDTFNLNAGCSAAVDDVWLFGGSYWEDFFAADGWSFHWNGETWETHQACGFCIITSVACHGDQVWATTRNSDTNQLQYVLQFSDGTWSRSVDGYSDSDPDQYSVFRDVWVGDDDRVVVVGATKYYPAGPGSPAPTSDTLAWEIVDGQTIDLLSDYDLEGELRAVTIDERGTVWAFGDLGLILEVRP